MLPLLYRPRPIRRHHRTSTAWGYSTLPLGGASCPWREELTVSCYPGGTADTLKNSTDYQREGCQAAIYVRLASGNNVEIFLL